MNQLYEYMHRMLAATPNSFTRYLYSQINWENKMLGLVGPRGVGKTTLFLQHIKQTCPNSSDLNDVLFVSADNMYFSDHTLFDTADNLVKRGAKEFYIDEIHKYPNWSKELKAIYDSFPDLKVRFTGSSILEIEHSAADLSRRAPMYRMQGLSFREYLGIKKGASIEPHSLEQILAGEIELANISHPLPLFKEYLRTGYYPFGDDPDFQIELEQVIERTLSVDIPQFANMNSATGFKLKQLMMIISTLVPFKPNMTKLASQIRSSRNNIEEYLLYMERAGLIAQLKADETKLSGFGKTKKVYLDNTNILYTLAEDKPNIGTVRETFFYNQMRVLYEVTASKISDFEIDGITFEVGGKSKSSDQLKDADNGIIVKDDIEFGSHNVVPLWAFGLMY